MDKVHVFFFGLFTKVMPEEIVFHKSRQPFIFQLSDTQLKTKQRVLYI